MSFDKTSVATAPRESPKWSHEYSDEHRLPSQLGSLSLPLYLPFNSSHIGNRFDPNSNALEYTLDRFQTGSTNSTSIESPLISSFPKRVEPLYHSASLGYPQSSTSTSYTGNQSSTASHLTDHYTSRHNSTVSDQGPYASQSGLGWVGASGGMYAHIRNSLPTYSLIDSTQNHAQESISYNHAIMNEFNSPRTRIDSATPGEIGGYIRDLPANPVNVERQIGEPYAVPDSSNRFDATAPFSTQGPKKRPRKRLSASQRLAHNTIEKRYRVKINAKIAELNKIVPLHIPGSENFSEDATLGQGSNTSRLNKSLTLERATEYIAYLGTENAKLERQVEALAEQLNVKSKAKLMKAEDI